MPDSEPPVTFTREKLSNVDKTGSKAALEMGALFQSPGLQKLLNSGHFKIWDEWVALYLQKPDLFTLKAQGTNIFLLERKDSTDIWPLYEKMFVDAAGGHEHISVLGKSDLYQSMQGFIGKQFPPFEIDLRLLLQGFEPEVRWGVHHRLLEIRSQKTARQQDLS